MTRTYGTVTHMSPELLLEGRLSKAADVYSFGVLLWQVRGGGEVLGSLERGGFRGEDLVGSLGRAGFRGPGQGLGVEE